MPTELKPQTDFSAGEIDPELKRDSKSPVTMGGARTITNWRILNAKGLTNRSGRRALFKANDRVEEVLMAPGVVYYINFANGFFKVFNASGIEVFSEVRPWNATTAKDVVWAVYDKSIYVTFGGTIMRPRIYTWDGATTWSAADYVEQVNGGTQKRTLFYRIAPKGITLAVSALTGVVNITFSAAVLVAGMVGTRIRFNGKQMTIATVTGPTTGTATVNETPLDSNRYTLRLTAYVSAPGVGMTVSQTITGASATIVSFTPGAPFDVVVEMLTSNKFQILGGFGSDQILNGATPVGTMATITAAVPAATVIWDQEVMNDYQGYPASVFVDQNRLGFCNFPSVPSAIAWSTVINFVDMYPDAFASDGLSTDAIFELVPGKRQVFYVIPGMDASEFVFCDRGLFYVQITPANPLRPGSVGFSLISEDEVGQVQPRRAGEFIVYVGAGLGDLFVVKIYGAYTRAYKTECITELNGHLFVGIRALAIMTATSEFSERYVFALNTDGTVIVGIYSLGKSNDLEGGVGFVRWSGNGTAKWVAVRGSSILFTASYAPNGIGAVQLAETVDNSRYLDSSQLYNTQPTGLPIPVGKGPLWYIPGGSVDLMEGPLGTRQMGTYLIDADGFIVPQGIGEDLASATLVVGQPWTAILEPFIPPAQGGQDVGQRIKKRRIKKVEVTLSNSTGCLFQSLYSGQSGPLLPAYGTPMTEFRVTTYQQGEDSTLPPVLREQSYHQRPTGRSHDPRWRLVKDTSGPITIEEIGMEITV